MPGEYPRRELTSPGKLGRRTRPTKAIAARVATKPTCKPKTRAAEPPAKAKPRPATLPWRRPGPATSPDQDAAAPTRRLLLRGGRRRLDVERLDRSVHTSDDNACAWQQAHYGGFRLQLQCRPATVSTTCEAPDGVRFTCDSRYIIDDATRVGNTPNATTSATSPRNVLGKPVGAASRGTHTK